MTSGDAGAAAQLSSVPQVSSLAKVEGSTPGQPTVVALSHVENFYWHKSAAFMASVDSEKWCNNRRNDCRNA